jgi:hypothetical protein
MKHSLDLSYFSSNLRPSYLKAAEFNISVILMLIGVTYFSFRQAVDKACCDASIYYAYGESLISNSLLIAPTASQPSDLRTFVYPITLSFLIRVADFLSLEPRILITIFQSSIYFISCRFLASTFLVHSKKTAKYVWLVLTLNVFVWPYLSVTLTDSLYVSLFLLFLALMLRIENDVYYSSKITLGNLFFFVLVFSVSLELRPATIWLLPVLLYYLLKVLRLKSSLSSSKFLVVMLGFIPSYYQIYINLYLFNKFTPLPVVDLGAMQIDWGIKYLKYITWLGGGSPQGIYTSENLIGNVSDNQTYGWYIENPVLGIKLIFVKLVGAFDFDFLVPYPTGNPWYSGLAGFLSLSIFVLGAGIAIRLTFSRIHAGSIFVIPRLLPISLFLSWSAVNIFSAVELRFTLPILTLFMIIIASSISLLKYRINKRLILNIFIPYLLAMFIVMNVAYFVRAQSSF